MEEGRLWPEDLSVKFARVCRHSAATGGVLGGKRVRERIRSIISFCHPKAFRPYRRTDLRPSCRRSGQHPMLEAVVSWGSSASPAPASVSPHCGVRPSAYGLILTQFEIQKRYSRNHMHILSRVFIQHVLPHCSVPCAPLCEAEPHILHTVRSNFAPQRCKVPFISAGHSHVRGQLF
jgi:hypothetical protein